MKSVRTALEICYSNQQIIPSVYGGDALTRAKRLSILPNQRHQPLVNKLDELQETDDFFDIVYSNMLLAALDRSDPASVLRLLPSLVLIGGSIVLEMRDVQAVINKMLLHPAHLIDTYEIEENGPVTYRQALFGYSDPQRLTELDAKTLDKVRACLGEPTVVRRQGWFRFTWTVA